MWRIKFKLWSLFVWFSLFNSLFCWNSCKAWPIQLSHKNSVWITFIPNCSNLITNLFSFSLLTPLSRFLFNKGCRVAIRGKVNEPLHTGLRVVDTILTLGKGQRQLIIGDRVSGKTSIYLNSILTQSTSNALFGNKRCFCV